MGLAGQSTRTWALVAGVLTLALSGLFGGLDKAPEQRPKAVGDVIDAGGYKVTIISARAVASHPKVFGLKEGNHLLGVTIRLEITGDTSWNPSAAGFAVVSDVLRLVDIDGIQNVSEQFGLPATRASTVILSRDGKMTQMVHPGLPEELEFFWEQAAGAGPPSQLTIQVMGQEYRESSLTDHWEWAHDDKKTVKVAVPLKDQRSSTRPTPTSVPTPTPKPSVTPTASTSPSKKPTPTPSSSKKPTS